MNDGGYLAVSPHSSDIVFATGNVYDAAYFLGVSHTSDGGTTWEHDTLPAGSRGWAVAFDPIDPNRVYVGGDSAYSYSALLITTDLGATWTMSHTGLSGTVNALVTVPDNGQFVYAGTNNGVFKSTDAGATWSATTLTWQVRTLVIDPDHTENLYAGTYGYGVYASTDAGSTWATMNVGLTNNNILSLALRSDAEVTLYAGTEGGGVCRTSLPTGIAGPTPASRPGAPVSVLPNPCRDFALLNLGLTEPSLVRVQVYDQSGRQVVAPSSRQLLPGNPVWRLDTRGLVNGTYFVRLEMNGTRTLTRLVVLR